MVNGEPLSNTEIKWRLNLYSFFVDPIPFTCSREWMECRTGKLKNISKEWAISEKWRREDLELYQKPGNIHVQCIQYMTLSCVHSKQPTSHAHWIIEQRQTIQTGGGKEHYHALQWDKNRNYTISNELVESNIIRLDMPSNTMRLVEWEQNSTAKLNIRHNHIIKCNI